MIKSQNVAMVVAAIIALAAGIIVYAVLGTESLVAVAIEFGVVIAIFIIMMIVLPYTNKEMADVATQLKRADVTTTVVGKIKEIDSALRELRNQMVTGQIKQIIEISNNILYDMLKPNRFDLPKMTKLAEYLTDFQIYFIYYINVVSGRLSVENRQKEILEFETNLPQTVDAFNAFATRVDGAESQMAKAHAQALKTKMAMDGLNSSINTLKDISEK